MEYMIDAVFFHRAGIWCQSQMCYQCYRTFHRLCAENGWARSTKHLSAKCRRSYCDAWLLQVKLFKTWNVYNPLKVMCLNKKGGLRERPVGWILQVECKFLLLLPMSLYSCFYEDCFGLVWNKLLFAGLDSMAVVLMQGMLIFSLVFSLPLYPFTPEDSLTPLSGFSDCWRRLQQEGINCQKFKIAPPPPKTQSWGAHNSCYHFWRYIEECLFERIPMSKSAEREPA